MAPVPVRTLRLSELDEKDRTAYFSVTALMERGKAVAARQDTSAPPPPPPGEPEVPLAVTLPLKPSLFQQLREASLARKATLVLLPMLIGLLILKPVFKAPAADATNPLDEAAPEPLAAQHMAEAEPQLRLAATPAEPPPIPPKGVSLERAASDALAGGDFQRALGFYRELSRRQPDSAAYREATRILERRLRERRP